jgi:hypothetical protein
MFQMTLLSARLSAADSSSAPDRLATDREVSPVERVYDEGLVAHVDDPANPVARVEGGRGTRVVLDGPVIVAMFDILLRNLFGSVGQEVLLHDVGGDELRVKLKIQTKLVVEGFDEKRGAMEVLAGLEQ